MVSVPCRLRDRSPADLDLSGHGNGRTAALTHPGRAAEGDVTVHGRGHHSFAVAPGHLERGLDLVFRVREGANPTFDAFGASGGTGRTVTPGAPGDGTAPRGRTPRVRPVRYTAGDTEFRLATSLPDSWRHGIQPLSDLHHGRWGNGEMYGSGRAVIGDLHARSERGVRQGIHAAFVPLTLTRRLSSRRDAGPNAGGGEDGLPGRSYPRESKRPGSRWIRRATA